MSVFVLFFFFFNDTATSEIYTLSLHDALPICPKVWAIHRLRMTNVGVNTAMPFTATLTNAVPPGEIETSGNFGPRSEEHTSELQSHVNLVCRLLLEKKKKKKNKQTIVKKYKK